MELQIISKYLYFNDLKHLLRIDPDLKYYYHTTFNFINIPSNYIVPIHQVKQIVNSLKSMFPNLEEIVLNIHGNINIEDIDSIFANYINFEKVIDDMNLKSLTELESTTLSLILSSLSTTSTSSILKMKMKMHGLIKI